MSSPTKPPPLKPPRIPRTVSVPIDPVTIESNSTITTQQQQQQAARINLTNALKKAKAREQTLSTVTRDSNSSSESNGESPINRTNKSDSKITLKSNDIISSNNEERHRIASSSEQKKSPILPRFNGSSIPLKPKPPPSLNKPSQDTINDQDSSDDETFALPESSSLTNTTHKRPLLPPAKPRSTTVPAPSFNKNLIPLQKNTNRSVSTENSPPSKFKPLPRSKSHDNRVIAPEEIVKMTVDISELENSAFEDETNIVHNNLETNTIPISPSSVSSGIPDDSENPSPNFTESRDTTPSCIITSEKDECIDTIDHRSPSPNIVKEETDGGQISRPAPPPQKQPKKISGANQRRVVLKDSTSWITKKNNHPSPPSSPKSLLTPTVPPVKKTSNPHRPYRSIAILPDKLSSNGSSDLLQDTSKPLIGPSGQYYPPAIRSRTPDCQERTKVSDLSMRKTQSNERLLAIQRDDDDEFNKKNDIPKRYKITRRSSSFSGNQKIRPASMMDQVNIVLLILHVIHESKLFLWNTDNYYCFTVFFSFCSQKHRKEKESFSTSSTLNRSMTESAKDALVKEVCRLS